MTLILVTSGAHQVEGDFVRVQTFKRIEITGTKQQDDRRDSATAKIVVTRGDVNRYGCKPPEKLDSVKVGLS